MGKLFYVAEINTYYGVVGLADTEAEAVRLAAVKAKEYLDQVEGCDPDTHELWEVEKIISYFDPRVTVLEMGSAQFEGEGRE